MSSGDSTTSTPSFGGSSSSSGGSGGGGDFPMQDDAESRAGSPMQSVVMGNSLYPIKEESSSGNSGGDDSYGSNSPESPDTIMSQAMSGLSINGTRNPTVGTTWDVRPTSQRTVGTTIDVQPSVGTTIDVQPSAGTTEVVQPPSNLSINTNGKKKKQNNSQSSASLPNNAGGASGSGNSADMEADKILLKDYIDSINAIENDLLMDKDERTANIKYNERKIQNLYKKYVKGGRGTTPKYNKMVNQLKQHFYK